MTENLKNIVNVDIIPDKIISTNSSNFNIIKKITPYLFNIKTIICIVIIGIVLFFKNKYKNVTNIIKKSEDSDLYDYIIMDKNNKVWKVSKDFFNKLSNQDNYKLVPPVLLNNINNNIDDTIYNMNNMNTIKNMKSMNNMNIIKKNKKNKKNSNYENYENVENLDENTSDIISDNIAIND